MKIIAHKSALNSSQLPHYLLCFKFEVTEKEITEAVETLKMKYSEKSGIQLLCFNNKLQFSSNPNYVDHVSAILNPWNSKGCS